MKQCAVCSGATASHKTLYDDRFGYPGLFEIMKCGGCGHKFVSGDFTPELLRMLYTDYYPRSTFHLDEFRPAKEAKGFFSWLNGERRLAYSWIPEKVRVLDIGCGFGETLAYHRSRGCDVYGVEADENIRRVADKFGFKVHVGLFDPDVYEPGFFDYVTMDQVIEHVSDPLATMRGIVRVLRQGGSAIVSTPNSNGWGANVFGNRWINWHVPYHQQFFSVQSMKLAGEQAGLVLEKARTITSSEWLRYQWIHLMTFPAMGKPSTFWSPLVTQGKRERVVMQLPHVLHWTKFNHVATRMFDALGVGDNYLFFLRKR